MEELQLLLLATLKASGPVMEVVDQVYDHVDGNAWKGKKKAYVSFGPHDVVDDDAECILAGVHTLQIDVWTRSVGAIGNKAVCGAIKKALHRAELELTINALADIRVPSIRVIDDPDGVTHHGIVTVEADIEEAA